MRMMSRRMALAVSFSSAIDRLGAETGTTHPFRRRYVPEIRVGPKIPGGRWPAAGNRVKAALCYRRTTHVASSRNAVYHRENGGRKALFRRRSSGVSGRDAAGRSYDGTRG